MKFMFTFIGNRAAYKRRRTGLGPEFVAFMDELMSKTPVVPNVDVLAQWKADIASERPLAER
jgi:hypothetical protein